MIATILRASLITEPQNWQVSLAKVWTDQEYLRHDANLFHHNKAEGIIGELKEAYQKYQRQDQVSIPF